jgi:hypothetical protein
VTAKHSHGTRATAPHSRSHRISLSRRSSGNLTQSSENRQERRNSTELSYEDKTLPSVPEGESFVYVQHPSFPEAGPYRGSRAESVERPTFASPDPLPHPYRRRDSTIEETDNQSAVQFPVPQVNGSPEPTFPVPVPSDGPVLHRKRSSLKRSSSRLSNKSVAWAVDLEQQKARYEAAVEEIEVAGKYFIIVAKHIFSSALQL